MCYTLNEVVAGATTTKFLESLPFSPKAIEVVSPGMNTTIQVRPFDKGLINFIEHHDDPSLQDCRRQTKL